MIRNLFFLWWLLPCIVFSQASEENVSKGKLSGQWRTYYMTTFNKGGLKDYSAFATGGNIKYHFQLNEKFQFGAALYNSTNLGVQDLTVADVSTGKISRYEEGLFNRLDLSNDAVFLLGELYVKYKLPRHEFTVGRMKINTPLINPEDGRMIPTLVQGVWYKHKVKKDFFFQAGLLNRIAPRSTGKFFTIGESIGTYPVGRNRDGSNNEYANNTDSDFIVLLNANMKVLKAVQMDVWNYYVDNIYNSLYIRPSYSITPKIVVDLEWLHQNRVGNGGNTIESFRYFDQNSSDILGVRLNYKWKKSMISISYDKIMPHGQFISPREWGREDLFSFQKRERSEGSANNDALVLNFKTNFPVWKDQMGLTSILSVGRHWKPEVTNADLNKYAVPDYTHINLDLFFNLKKVKHLKPELLLTSKLANGDIPDNPNFYFNKTDMFHIDLILNYNF
ncbi:OprD family outer membrane porin [Maribacter sp. MMG018]|uniref:OprD family outer membrane porin n=1 Tax=Maribacter sp. MMG018 TaxID=2822688 RepID=UPI001B3740CD|nr:OprD family outer membrane porin [Maribacter sp. MMG018]MBQ4914683.1 OprD family outer membrane porin [Maribacter sp. MMG018]